MIFRRADAGELDRVTGFYRFVTANTEHIGDYAHWEYGVHPDDDTLRTYIGDANMYLLEDNGVICAAAAVTPFQGAEYHNAEWQIQAADDEVSVVHLLCVNPLMQKKGMAKQLIREITDLSRAQGKRALRLDTLCCNIAAQKLYASIGFKLCGIEYWYDWMDFNLYEYIL